MSRTTCWKVLVIICRCGHKLSTFWWCPKKCQAARRRHAHSFSLLGGLGVRGLHACGWFSSIQGAFAAALWTSKLRTVMRPARPAPSYPTKDRPNLVPPPGHCAEPCASLYVAPMTCCKASQNQKTRSRHNPARLKERSRSFRFAFVRRTGQVQLSRKSEFASGPATQVDPVRVPQLCAVDVNSHSNFVKGTRFIKQVTESGMIKFATWVTESGK